MLELGSVFVLVQKSLEIPQVKDAAANMLSWISSKVFSGKEKTQDELKQLEQQEADAATVTKLESKLELVLEDNDALRQELEGKVAKLTQLLKQAEAQMPNPTITITQTHTGPGDNVGRDKIVRG